MKTRNLQGVASCLILLKIVYFIVLGSALSLFPDFNEQCLNNVNARWFVAVGAVPPRALTSSFDRHFATWDSEHYLYLSEAGYRTGLPSCAFYPLWPLIVRGFSSMTAANHLVAGLLLANLFSLVAWLLLYQSVDRYWGQAAATWTLLFIIAFPGSLFFQFNYSESLFFLLVLVLWRGLDERNYALTFLAGFLLPLTRGVGVFVILPVAGHALDRASCWLRNRGQGRTLSR